MFTSAYLISSWNCLLFILTPLHSLSFFFTLLYSSSFFFTPFLLLLSHSISFSSHPKVKHLHRSLWPHTAHYLAVTSSDSGMEASGALLSTARCYATLRYVRYIRKVRMIFDSVYFFCLLSFSFYLHLSIYISIFLSLSLSLFSFTPSSLPPPLPLSNSYPLSHTPGRPPRSCFSA
jgi:hypothetical protein